MKIPKNPRISGITWTVLMSPAVDKVLDADNRLGLAVFSTSEIYLKKEGRTWEAIWETFWHECAHIIFHNTGITHTILTEDGLEEGVVEAAGNGVWQILRDNGIIEEE